MNPQVRRLLGPFGAEVFGVDLGAAYDVEQLRLALYEHRFIVIRDQHLDLSDYVRFARQWGRPREHAVASKQVPNFPEVTTVGNVEKPLSVINDAVYWHTDKAYESSPSHVTMLYSVKAPRAGGATLFADMVAAYDELPEATKRNLEGLVAAHLYGSPSGTFGRFSRTPALAEAMANEPPPAFHSLVMAHPRTGRKAIYGVAGTAFAIVDMSQADATDLLSDVRGHALSSRFVNQHTYRVGDLVLWDGLSTLHSATPMGRATTEMDSRMLYRITVGP